MSTTPAGLRRTHRGMALSRIETAPGISRSELARELGFSEMAATRIVRELLEIGLVEEFEEAARARPRKKSVGRPKTGLRIVPDALFAVGITVSAYYSEVSICDAAGEIRASQQIKNPPFARVEHAARLYGEAVRDLVLTSGIEMDRIVGIGVALSARTDPKRGEILKSEYFGWASDGGRFCDEIRRIIDLPIEIENIANALAIAEMRFGAAREASQFTLVHVATFVGASVVSENRVVRGASGLSGLIGHFRSQPGELTCVCGRHDCLNLNATGFGLLSRLGRLDHSKFDTSRLSFYAGALMDVLGDGAAASHVADCAGRLAPAIDSMAKLLDPEVVIVSGHLGTNEVYFRGVEEVLMQEYDLGKGGSYTLVRGTIAPERAASLLGLHSFCYSERLDFDGLSETTSASRRARG